MKKKRDDLLVRTRRTLGLNQTQLAASVGASKRTSQRWFANQSDPAQVHYREFARQAYAVDPALAAELAKEGGTTLDALGLRVREAVAEAETTASPSAQTPVVIAPDVLVDSVICVAADAMGLVPSAVRPGLLAAFERAKRLGLSVETVEAALRGPPTSNERPGVSTEASAPSKNC